MASVTIHASCHCGLFSSTVSLPSSALPLKSAMCHCNTCRKTSGHLCNTFAVIPLPDRPDTTNLTAYASSAGLTRYFCTKCGARIWHAEEGEWEFSTGVLRVERRDGIRGWLNRVNLWVQDVRDGGLGLWLTDGADEGREWERHIRERTSEKVDRRQVESMSEQARRGISEMEMERGNLVQKLKARCHCGGVDFKIGRAETSAESSLGKFSAGLDACTSCRTVTGCEITSWARIPRDRITWADGQSLDVHKMPKTLGIYDTSPGIHRAFCKTCGANVFYFRDDERLDSIDVAAGLLESDFGARAEDWLVWDLNNEEGVEFREDGIDQEFVGAFEKGIQVDRAETER